MKSLTAGYRTHLRSGTLQLATCWMIERVDGTTFHFTDHQENITLSLVGDDSDLNGTYQATSGFSRGSIKGSVDLDVDHLQIDGIIDDASISVSDIRAGLFDFAEIRVFLVVWSDPSLGVLKLRRGWIGNITLKGKAYVAELLGMVTLLERPILSLFTPNCRTNFGSIQCGVTPDSHLGKVATVIEPRSKFTVVALGGGPFSPNPHPTQIQYGTITWASAANALNEGQKMEIKSYDDATKTVELFLDMPADISVDDEFDILNGCKLDFTTCRTEYANQDNFRGEPHVPTTDEMLKYPDVTDGGYQGGN